IQLVMVDLIRLLEIEIPTWLHLVAVMEQKHWQRRKLMHQDLLSRNHHTLCGKLEGGGGE
ncbi:hypothetical protein Tco_1073359, partial [Tanacetum coccineum]